MINLPSKQCTTFSFHSIKSQQEQLVQNLVSQNVIQSDFVKTILSQIDRADFTTTNPYQNSEQPIGLNQTIHSPYLHAYVLQLLSEPLKTASKILDVGCGSGYSTVAFGLAAYHMKNPQKDLKETFKYSKKTINQAMGKGGKQQEEDEEEEIENDDSDQEESEDNRGQGSNMQNGSLDKKKQKEKKEGAKKKNQIQQGQKEKENLLFKEKENMNFTVVGMEQIQDLAKQAFFNVRKKFYKLSDKGNVHIAFGDGSKGFQKFAPYDIIYVGASCRKVPEILLQQLAKGGTMLVPLENKKFDYQKSTLCLIKKDLNGNIKRKMLMDIKLSRLCIGALKRTETMEPLTKW